MRIFTVSDLHVDYKANLKWVEDTSEFDYKKDMLILAGDISDKINLITKVFKKFRKSFRYVYYVPGNHDLWVRDQLCSDSVEKFQTLKEVADDYGLHTEVATFSKIRIVPVLGWYDYSFGLPTPQLHSVWNDFSYCVWPDEFDYFHITEMFLNLNTIKEKKKGETLISFSHFLPTVKVMPSFIPESKRYLYPVLGSEMIGKQVEELSSDIHIYGHSHVNNDVTIGGTRYINNAYGYPSETRICAKKLIQVH